MAGTLGVTTHIEEQLSQMINNLVYYQKPITIASGAGVVKRGTVLGEVTVSNKFLPSLAASSDGSEVARCMLIDKEIDATAADVKCQAFFVGSYNYSDLVFAGTPTPAEIKTHLIQLQDRGIIVDVDFVDIV